MLLIDAGVVETERDQIEAVATCKVVSIPIIRSGNSTHPCQVTWTAEDGTAIRGKHYRAWRGVLELAADETRYLFVS